VLSLLGVELCSQELQNPPCRNSQWAHRVGLVTSEQRNASWHSYTRKEGERPYKQTFPPKQPQYTVGMLSDSSNSITGYSYALIAAWYMQARELQETPALHDKQQS
jgi:hypothetical protein